MERDIELFVLVFCLFLVYFVFKAVKYGIRQGFNLTVLTWCFFLLGTPVVNSGLLIDVPVKYLFAQKMHHTQLFVSFFGLFLSYCYLYFYKQLFTLTKHTRLLYKMITDPFSIYGILFIICGIGTLISAKLIDIVYDLIVTKSAFPTDADHYFLIYAIVLAVYYKIYYMFERS